MNLWRVRQCGVALLVGSSDISQRDDDNNNNNKRSLFMINLINYIIYLPERCEFK